MPRSGRNFLFVCLHQSFCLYRLVIRGFMIVLCTMHCFWGNDDCLSIIIDRRSHFEAFKCNCIRWTIQIICTDNNTHQYYFSDHLGLLVAGWLWNLEFFTIYLSSYLSLYETETASLSQIYSIPPLFTEHFSKYYLFLQLLFLNYYLFNY